MSAFFVELDASMKEPSTIVPLLKRRPLSVSCFLNNSKTCLSKPFLSRRCRKRRIVVSSGHFESIVRPTKRRHANESCSVSSHSDLSRQISQFLQQHTSFFHSFNVVKVYYDNGQTELTKILASVLPIYLNNVVFNKVSPKDYKLFQAADYVCTFRLLKEKLDNDYLTKSDLKFFSGKRELKKTYLAPLLTKIFL